MKTAFSPTHIGCRDTNQSHHSPRRWPELLAAAGQMTMKCHDTFYIFNPNSCQPGFKNGDK